MNPGRIVVLVILSALLGAGRAPAESIVGRWKAISDKTGEAKSIVELYEQDGMVYGKIVKLFQKEGEDPDPICDLCPGERKNQKILGMVIIEGLKRKGDKWVGGEILDPEDGKIYRCKAWLEDGTLRLRGYVSIFFRTQTWLPADAE